MLGKSIRIYHEIVFYTFTIQYFFKSIKKSFGLWSSRNKVNTLIPADVLGLTIQSTDAGTHKIDAPTLKPFSRVQVEDKLKEAYLSFQRDVSSGRLNVDGFEEEKFT